MQRSEGFVDPECDRACIGGEYHGKKGGWVSTGAQGLSGGQGEGECGGMRKSRGR